MVFVENGSHASYIDNYPGSTVRRTYPASLKCPNMWLNHYGKWGEDGGSVRSPVHRFNKDAYVFGDPLAYIWHEPMYWLDHI